MYVYLETAFMGEKLGIAENLGVSWTDNKRGILDDNYPVRSAIPTPPSPLKTPACFA
jgi:hypothetical protein